MNDCNAKVQLIFNMTNKKIYFLLLFFIFVGCKSASVSKRIVYRDSIQLVAVHDTVVKVVRDSTARTAESSTAVEFEFADGGEFDFATGKATNVKRVKVSGKQLTAEVVTHTADSTAGGTALAMQAGEQLEVQQEERVQERSKWDRFCSWWTIGTWIALLIAAAALIWKNKSKVVAWLIQLVAKFRF